MASAKRIFGTLLFLIAFLATCAFVFLLYAKSIGDKNFQDYYGPLGNTALWTGFALGLVSLCLILILLIGGSERKRRAAAFQEEQDRLAAERERMAAFEATLEEPEKIGWGPDIQVYNLPTVPVMPRAWEKFSRRTKSYTFYFPRSVDAAVYTNNYIPIDNQGTMLKLRTLIAGPPGAQQKEFGMGNKRQPPTVDLTKVPESVKARLNPPAAENGSEGMQTMETGSGGASGHSALVQEMESRFAGGRGTAAKPAAYYDYEGDVHDVEDVEGIGRIYGDKLRAAGVRTTARLCYEDAEDLAARVGVPVRTVETWKSMSELLKVSGIGPQYAEALARSGINGIQDLKRRSAQLIADQVNAYLGSIQTTVLGTKITEKRVASWQKAAAGMRKVRMKAPDE